MRGCAREKWVPFFVDDREMLATSALARVTIARFYFKCSKRIGIGWCVDHFACIARLTLGPTRLKPCSPSEQAAGACFLSVNGMNNNREEIMISFLPELLFALANLD